MLPLSRTASNLGASVFADLAPRIDARLRGGGDLIELHIGDTHVPPPREARFGLLEVADDESLYRYGPIAGLEALKLAFLERLAARGFGPPEPSPAQVLVGCGATHALFCAARALLDPGDEVLVATPYWPLSVGVLRSAGAQPVEVPLTTRLYAEKSFDPAAAFEEALTPRTRALYLITPNNPDGKVLSAAELSSIARFAIAHGLWVIADEVYADYVYEGPHTSIARLEGMPERTVTAFSLSKSHALAGARVGFVVGPERVIALARRVATHTVFNVPLASQRVALAALRTPHEGAWIEAARVGYREARDLAMSGLPGGLRAFRPEGGSYAFIDFGPVLEEHRMRARARSRDGSSSLRALLGRAIDHGVALAPGDAFGAGFASWARLCFTSVRLGRLKEGLARLDEAMRHWTASSDRDSD